MSLIKTSDDMIGRDEIAYNNMLIEIKKNKLSENSFIFVKNFMCVHDPKDPDITSKEPKAELVLVPFQGKYYFIRLTEKGHSLTAIYACYQKALVE